MPSPNEESDRHSQGPGTLEVPKPRPPAESPEEKARTQRLKLRDKALPERLVITSLICDALVITYALVFSFWLRFETPMLADRAPVPMALHNYSGYIAFGGIALIFTLTVFGIYERQALLRFRHVFLQVLKSACVWGFCFLGFALIFKFSPPISRVFVAIATVLVPGALLVWRIAFHSFLRRSSVAMSLRQRILFVGWNHEAERLTKAFSHDPSCAYEVVGLVELREGQVPAVKVRVLGDLSDLTDIIHRESVDMVVLTDVDGVKEDIVGLANTCEREMVQFKVIPSYFQILVSGLHLETVSGIPVLGVSRLPLDRFVNILIKRLVDVVGAIFGLIVSAPLILIFGALVYWESRGAIFYHQRRLGRNGVDFDILKIRSMKLDAEADGKVGWSTADDPRRLKIGSFMRRWNIDELPQFWNVLKGEMSLVGPRPERPELIRNFKHEIPHYNARHNAKPGITGWAQVKGLRGDTDLGERISCDLWYLENWSIFLDFQILAMTFFNNKNAC
ncbi:MAG: exopolysaccharide biosynthesis polyprenyl glycosylphosphotransferase [Chthoniobacter sp.]|nr:exopolysaccharide biosynthesis polyprenyl glycosylphosphotransferase [Chthoniobacter sp.]